MKYAFLPFNRGLAHVTRSLMVAAELQRQGHEVCCWLPASHERYAKEVGVPTQIDQPLLTEDHSGAVEGYLDTSFLRDRAAQLRPVLADYAPDLVIVDFHLPGLVAARSLGLPIVYLTHTPGLSSRFELPNTGLWPPLHAITRPVVGMFARHLLMKYVRVIDKALEAITGKKQTAFDGVQYLIPEPVGYIRTSLDLPKEAYCGPLLWPAFDAVPLPRELLTFPKHKTIYLTGGGTGWGVSFTAEIVTALLDHGYYVAMTTGGRFEKSALPESPHLLVADYLPGTVTAAHSQVVVCHGGYGTLVQAAVARTPTMSIPVNVDQLVHSSRWQELGYGMRVWPVTPQRLMIALRGDHRAFEEATEQTSPKVILEAVHTASRLTISDKAAGLFDYTDSPARAAAYILGLHY